MTPNLQHIELANAQTALATPTNISLAAGLAGALLMQSHLYSLQPEEARGERIIKMIASLIHQVQTREMSTGLWDGLTGILYSLEYTLKVAPVLVPPAVVEFIGNMDDLLIGYVAPDAEPQHFDIISGIAGLGAYALMRTNINAARLLYQAVEARLIGLSSMIASGRVWRTLPQFMSPFASTESREHGHVDLGLAHGLPGVVQLLAGAVRHGLATPQTGTYLREACDALISLQSDSMDGARYAYFDIHPSDSRLAWCYGDLSAAFAIYSAADALRHPVWLQMARTLLLERLQKPESSFGLEDAALCHGHSGVLHLVQKIAVRDQQPAYMRFVNERRAALGEGSDDFESRAGLLEGHAGVLLVLQNSPDLGRHHWDVCLCMGY